jgi:hypothetical protein
MTPAVETPAQRLRVCDTPCAELAEYLGRPLPIVTERCKYAPVELAWRWEEYKNDPIAFYRESDLYLFDLTLYHDLILEPQGMHRWFRDTVGRFGFKKLLDFGAGCGDWSLHALSAGATFSMMVDVDGVMRRYVKFRLGKRGFKWAAAKEGLSPIPGVFEVHERAVPVGGVALADNFDSGARYDAVICMDVFEHMAAPEETIAQMAKMAPYMFCNPGEIQYTWLYPQHISRFDLTSRFEHVDRYLWKSKEYKS